MKSNLLLPSEVSLPQVIARLDAWLDTMLGQEGYAGPGAVWQRDRLLFIGPEIYEGYDGIIRGYLNLYQKTGQSGWLAKAIRAGEYLVAGQLDHGRFINPRLDQSTIAGGVPDEAAYDLALLRLADVLRQEEDARWCNFYIAAEKNLQEYYLGYLWEPEKQWLRTSPGDPAFSPQNAASLIQALAASVDLGAETRLFDRMAVPLLEMILTFQVQTRGDPFEGAIDQHGLPGKLSGRYLPLVIARCIPTLLLGSEKTGEFRYHQAAQKAAEFLLGLQLQDGSFPQVVYNNGRALPDPRWVAASSEFLCALSLLDEVGNKELQKIWSWLLSGQLPSGGFCTASGIRHRWFGANSQLPDFRDVLPECSGAGKVFLLITGEIQEGVEIPQVNFEETRMKCQFRGHPTLYLETEETIELWQADRVQYRWRKGEQWAEIYNL